MCGIAGMIQLGGERLVRAGVEAMRHRGPDAQDVQVRGRAVIGHARLSIIDPGPRSNQPFAYRHVLLAYNGELWNAPELRRALQMQGCTFATAGDTEVVAAALAVWGVAALDRLDGMFALLWHDGGATFAARDRYGEIPLHWSPRLRAVASELKGLRAMGARDAEWLPPGSYVQLDATGPSVQRWHVPSAIPSLLDLDDAAALLRCKLVRACERRTVADVPVCTLLSGGLDSSVIALEMGKRIPNLVAYSAVMNELSRDRRCARAVADQLGVELREVKIDPPTADDLATVVRMIEQPHKAQVEIGWACLALARRMQADGFRVTFSGEGSDELWASYGFAYHGVQKDGWHEYRRKLFLEQHRKNFARCNKIFLSHGVECRLPFLDRELVPLALSLRREAVGNKAHPKEVLARAYDRELPDDVLRRPKVAFQDGLGLKDHAARAVADPARFYRAEFSRTYGDVKP